jgi:hypothetical protein
MGELQNRLETLVQKSSQLEAELKNQKKTWTRTPQHQVDEQA